MHVAIDYGRQHVELEVADSALVESQVPSPPAALADPAAAVRVALESPFEFPPLRRALTPEDQASIEAYAARYIQYAATYKTEKA